MRISSFARNCHYDVIGLENNKKYSFRVRAENQYGVGPALESDFPITAKYPFTVPDAPGRPRIADSDQSSVTISWERPLSDGGSRIQGYRVEYRDVFEGGDWKLATEYLVKETRYAPAVYILDTFIYLYTFFVVPCIPCLA
jgi:hypothetical protein